AFLYLRGVSAQDAKSNHQKIPTMKDPLLLKESSINLIKINSCLYYLTSEAIDKIRFLSLTDPNALKSNPHLNITIWTDSVNKALIITDIGIGMTHQQLKEI
ncbi:930_t:CDS:2, partial [Gigaspora rosea]